MATKINIVHFNDVYNIQARETEPVGGAARFSTAIKSHADLNPLVLFSGDALNPSIMSTFTKGKQMVPVLNGLNVACAVCGNHDFDHGVDNLVQLRQEMNFPWLLSNVYDVLTGFPLADALVTHIIEWQGKKIGLVGLVEKDWMETLSTVDPEDIEYLDFVEEGNKLCKELRDKGVDCIIALTHMRWPNDIRLAESIPDIDLILGGHDHDFIIKKVNDKYIIKSGTDFRNYALVTLTFPENPGSKVEVSYIEKDVTSALAEDESIKKIVDEYNEVLQMNKNFDCMCVEIIGAEMENVIGNIYTELDGRFASIRHHESSLGNFVTDIIMAASGCDVALLNSGTLRSDAIHPQGEFKMKDLMAILPMPTAMVVLEVTGAQLITALENAVCKYPALEGRFSQVAGVSFTFDPSKPPGERIVRESVKVEGVPLDLEKTYKTCCSSYIAAGKDGYDVLKNCPVLVNEENGPQLNTIVKNHFASCKFATGADAPKYQHWQSITSAAKRKALMATIMSEQAGAAEKMTAAVEILRSSAPRQAAASQPASRWIKAKATVTEQKKAMIHAVECLQAKAALSPRLEGRIKTVED